MVNSWLLLLPIAAAFGWIIGRRKSAADKQLKPLSHEYFVGLNYLLNEQPDKAVDVFVKLLEVDNDT
ncbi:MAG: lipopolysaccharide assembly protein LapB, partial [Gammaproteobacteria bacterium]